MVLDYIKLKVRNILNSKYMLCYTLVFAIILEFIIFGSINARFYSYSNIVTVLRQISLYSIVAVGTTALLISNSIDMSFGALVGLAGAVTGVLLGLYDVPIFVSIIAGIGVSTLLGLFNGLITQLLKLPAFIITLAMLFIAQGINYQITGGYAVPIPQQQFWTIGQGSLLGVPLPIIYMIIAFILGNFWLKKTLSGRRVYAVGSNESAAYRAGISVKKVRIALFTLNGILAGIAGVILAARLGAGTPMEGTEWLLNVKAAVIVGGASLNGGKGNLFGTYLGLVFMGFLANGMIMWGISPNIQLVVKGLFIIIAVWLQSKQK